MTGLKNDDLNDNYIHNNSIPDDSRDGRIAINSVGNCTSTRVVNNKVVTNIGTAENGTPCVIVNNSSSAAGATEMTPTTQVGCNFDGCASEPPTTILSGGFVTPCPYVPE